MAVHSLTDYFSLDDAGFDISPNEPKEIRFNMPNDAVLVDNARKPILMYTVLPINTVKYTVSFNPELNFAGSNDPVQEAEQLNERVFRSVHEAVRGSRMQTGTNTMLFEVVSGRARFTDVVLWFQRNIDTTH